LNDLLIALGLALLAAFVFWTTPEFAASLPQDAPDYAIPAVNLLERGRLVVSAYGHDFPPAHPPGMPLLLLPSYILFGYFPGNGIYAVLLCSVSTVVLTYIIGVKLGGRLCGCSAALFLIAHHGFWQFSRKIMSEVPSALFGIAVFALLLKIRDRKRPGLACLAIGAILGFAITIRNDNVLLLVPAALLLAWEGAGRERLQRVGLTLVGMVPFLIGLAVYDQVTFGSPWRTGYHYWGGAGSAKRPLFSAGYITKSGFLRLVPIIDPKNAEGNGTLLIKSLLDQSDTTQIFGLGAGALWHLPGFRLYQTVVLLRTTLGAIGLLACLVGWRTNRLRQRFLLWLVLITFAYVGFFLMYYYRDERFLVRLVPVFCLADGVGVAALLAKWPSKCARATVLVVVGALIGRFMLWNAQMGFPTGDQQGIYETLTWVASQIEPNAVVVSNFSPLWVDAYIIHGTHRIAVPLGHKYEIPVFIGGDLTPTFISPFVASRDPERLRELLHSGLPVYWLIESPWREQAADELETLARSFRLTALASAKSRSRADHPFFGRVDDLPQQH